MRFITALALFFYTFVFFLFGGVLIAFALDVLGVQNIYKVVELMQLNMNTKIITGAAGAFLILVSISIAQLILGRFEKEKTIAFNTATGQVTIALQAVEDLIRRLGQHFSGIKELRPNVIASKKGVEVNLRVILQSEVSIPDLTSNLQDMIKTRVQELLGIEEQITVKVHIAKIISYGEKRKKGETSEEITPPYSGYSRK
ncbi:MAG: hypothetical protein AMJ78_00165 [Omnitrophica WOR_2 bacterium SM23_29]|nr:MAG: hypothetical protein AMJ78_00165 [Omnitrophica WOR_2 bacterium SM23_29]